MFCCACFYGWDLFYIIPHDYPTGIALVNQGCRTESTDTTIANHEKNKPNLQNDSLYEW